MRRLHWFPTPQKRFAGISLVKIAVQTSHMIHGMIPLPSWRRPERADLFANLLRPKFVRSAYGTQSIVIRDVARSAATIGSWKPARCSVWWIRAAVKASSIKATSHNNASKNGRATAYIDVSRRLRRYIAIERGQEPHCRPRVICGSAETSDAETNSDERHWSPTWVLFRSELRPFETLVAIYWARIPEHSCDNRRCFDSILNDFNSKFLANDNDELSNVRRISLRVSGAGWSDHFCSSVAKFDKLWQGGRVAVQSCWRKAYVVLPFAHQIYR